MDVWNDLINQSSKYMKYQTNENHFEYFGIDIIIDEYNTCYLIEVNRLPGLESSNNNFIEENQFYDKMMSSLLNIVMKPIFKTYNESEVDQGLWKKIREPNEDMIISSDSPTWKNLFQWKAYTRKQRSKIMIRYLE